MTFKTLLDQSNLDYAHQSLLWLKASNDLYQAISRHVYSNASNHMQNHRIVLILIFHFNSHCMIRIVYLIYHSHAYLLQLIHSKRIDWEEQVFPEPTISNPSSLIRTRGGTIMRCDFSGQGTIFKWENVISIVSCIKKQSLQTIIGDLIMLTINP